MQLVFARANCGGATRAHEAILERGIVLEGHSVA